MLRENFTTFINLPEAKQKSILQAAISEFSQQGYAKASCNQIVRTASISKGSLFQYFGSKEGLFSYICGRFIRKVKDAVKLSSVTEHGFFDLLRDVLLAGVAFIDSYPEYFQIYLKIIGERDVPGRTTFLSQVRLFSADYFGDVYDRAVETGVLRPGVSKEIMLFSVDAILDKFFVSYATGGPGSLNLAGLNHKALHCKINELVAVLEQGLKK